MRHALIGFAAVVLTLGAAQANAKGFDNSTPPVKSGAYTAEATPDTAAARHEVVELARRNALILAAWGEPVQPGVENALYVEKVELGSSDDRPLASSLEDFRRDIAISNAWRGR